MESIQDVSMNMSLYTEYESTHHQYQVPIHTPLPVPQYPQTNTYSCQIFVTGCRKYSLEVLSITRPPPPDLLFYPSAPCIPENCTSTKNMEIKNKIHHWYFELSKYYYESEMFLYYYFFFGKCTFLFDCWYFFFCFKCKSFNSHKIKGFWL